MNEILVPLDNLLKDIKCCLEPAPADIDDLLERMIFDREATFIPNTKKQSVQCGKDKNRSVIDVIACIQHHYPDKTLEEIVKLVAFYIKNNPRFIVFICGNINRLVFQGRREYISKSECKDGIWEPTYYSNDLMVTIIKYYQNV